MQLNTQDMQPVRYAHVDHIMVHDKIRISILIIIRRPINESTRMDIDNYRFQRISYFVQLINCEIVCDEFESK